MVWVLNPSSGDSVLVPHSKSGLFREVLAYCKILHSRTKIDKINESSIKLLSPVECISIGHGRIRPYLVMTFRKYRKYQMYRANIAGIFIKWVGLTRVLEASSSSSSSMPSQVLQFFAHFVFQWAIKKLVIDSAEAEAVVSHLLSHHHQQQQRQQRQQHHPLESFDICLKRIGGYCYCQPYRSSYRLGAARRALAG